jgi:hypothetical protein
MIRWAFGLFALLVSALPASAGLWNWWDALPPCGKSEVLYRISERAAWAEHYTWHRGWIIRAISNVGETALDPTRSKVHRRYCRATAWLSDGRRTPLVYVIEAGQGFASIGWNVEFCLPAYDPWRVYDAWCHAIEPNW